ncbi:protein neprosin-like [Tasmannia lanceolata]|uniref:protein neprosin-like n=1 Tax=Tasmannia lanceolata TaxID=3420 RepID=UPI004064AFE6
MRPNSFPKETIRDGASSVGKQLQIGLKDGGCPTGTVPIRRTQKEDLIRAKSSNMPQPTSSDPRLGHNAFFRTTEEVYYGTRLYMNTWALDISDDQYSMVTTWVRNQQESIQAGWMVQPALFGDSKTRLFTFWTKDAFHGTGCYNTICPGFVQVSQMIPLGMVLPVSTYNGTQTDIFLYVTKDLSSGGNWWLSWGTNEQQVGYWPNDLFESLADNSSSIAWGGQTYGPLNKPLPPMGSGFTDGCYLAGIQVMNGNLIYYDPENHVRKVDENCYQISKAYRIKGDFGFYIGGPDCYT